MFDKSFQPKFIHRCIPFRLEDRKNSSSTKRSNKLSPSGCSPTSVLMVVSKALEKHVATLIWDQFVNHAPALYVTYLLPSQLIVSEWLNALDKYMSYFVMCEKRSTLCYMYSSIS